METHQRQWATRSDCCSVAFAPPPCWDTPAPRPDFSVAVGRDSRMIVVAIHNALSCTSATQLRQVLLDLVDHLPTRSSYSDDTASPQESPARR